jgi:lipid A ethanolaminephosphotransferase
MQRECEIAPPGDPFLSIANVSHPVRPTRLLARPRISSVIVATIGALYFIAFTNRTFWVRAYAYFDNRLALTVFGLGLTCLFLAFFFAFAVKHTLKPLLIFLIISAAASSWFMDRFGTIIDIDMIRNAMQTTSSEAGHLITMPFLLHIGMFGIIPALLVLWVRVEYLPILTSVKRNAIAVGLLLLVAAACSIGGARSILAVTRNHQDLMMTLNPVAPVGSAIGMAIASQADKDIIPQPLGTDARVAAAMPSGKPRVLIIVAGETARAENFSLGGYGKETNPELSVRDITYFTDTASCGTATSVSLPCMFSNLTRKGYSHRAGLANENLLDVLRHAGVPAEWWDNNTGSKGIARRITHKSFSRANDPRYCKNNECFDEGMLAQLGNWLSNVKGDSVLVLHQIGSHGPAYYQRYPASFQKFTPDCRNDALETCSHAEIVNAYDNTILYTDHFLASIIDTLKAREDRIAPAMIYMSDHGESLGEYGLYLHGAPYIVAPSQQTHVPFILWQGSEIKAGINAPCLSERAKQPASHDNLFHTALGLLNIQTSVYSADLDVLGSCRKSAALADS